MASTRLTSTLQVELDIGAKLSNLEVRASNLESEFSRLLQSARQLLLSTKRYVEKLEIENKSWDLLENILESENSSRQILDYLKIFFNFLLGRLQGRGADIVDILMLSTLIDTEGVRRLFIDALVWFGFKEKDVKNVELLLAVVCKDHMKNIECGSDDPVEMLKTIEEKLAKQEAMDLSLGALEAGKSLAIDKQLFKSPDVEPLHDASVEVILKSWEANEGINIFGMDEELRRVLKRMIAVVIFTLNIGKSTVTGLYGTETLGAEEGDKNNNKVERNKSGCQINLADEVMHNESNNNLLKHRPVQGHFSDADVHGIQVEFGNHNNNARNVECNSHEVVNASEVIPVETPEPHSKRIMTKDPNLDSDGTQLKRDTNSDADNIVCLVPDTIPEEMKTSVDDMEDGAPNRDEGCIVTNIGCKVMNDNNGNENCTAENTFNDMVSDEEEIKLLEKNICSENETNTSEYDIIDEIEAFLSLG